MVSGQYRDHDKRFDTFRNLIVDFDISLLTLTQNSSDPCKRMSNRLLLEQLLRNGSLVNTSVFI